MIGFRGASRYYTTVPRRLRARMRAIKRAREQMGFANIVIMIPSAARCRKLTWF